MADFVDEDALRNRFAADQWLQLFDDDQDGVADPEIVATVLADANADVKAALKGKGYTDADLDKLVADDLLRRIATATAMGYAGERRSEWLNERGEGRYHAQRARAEKRLEKLQKAQLRIPTEESVGVKNKQVGAGLDAADPPFVFAASAADRASGKPGPGGF